MTKFSKVYIIEIQPYIVCCVVSLSICCIKEVWLLKCPKCDYIDSKVLDSRPSDEGNAIRRRRECNNCYYRFTTYEKIEETPIIVIKKNNMREVFNSEKIFTGILKACEKRPISISKIEELTREIEQNIKNSLKKEVTSSEIGEMTMEKLKEVDEIAYVRFASVYRQFKDINVLAEEIKQLLK